MRALTGGGFGHCSTKKYTKAQNDVGNSAYDALMMFKILLLQVEATKLASCEMIMKLM